MNTKRLIGLLGIVVAMLTGAVAYSEDVDALRAGGQDSVDALHARLANGEIGEALLDRVCAQKDCSASRLYWHTDLESAKEAARGTGRPIVALYMLGRLDEELSCANSRFFRTLLYADDAISSVLRDEFVVYWHSVRPVPRITIELGDGRVIRQTITGNSVHYLLSEEGEVLDALPGLHSPSAFRGHLHEWLSLYRSLAGQNERDRAAALAFHHERRAGPENLLAAEPADAESASRRAATKAILEVPVLRMLRPDASERLSEAPSLSAVSAEEIESVAFSPGAVRLMGRKQPIDEELLGAVRVSVATDTYFNQSVLHPQIHRWFAEGKVSDLESLNERIYRELFLTPPDDPWMGLKPPTIFTALSE